MPSKDRYDQLAGSVKWSTAWLRSLAHFSAAPKLVNCRAIDA